MLSYLNFNVMYIHLQSAGTKEKGQDEHFTLTLKEYLIGIRRYSLLASRYTTPIVWTHAVGGTYG